LKNEKGDVVFSVGDEVRESIKLDKIIKYDVTGELQGLIPEFTEDGDKELGSRVVVFSQFKGPLAELERRLKTAGISVVRFDGDTPDDIRNQAKLDFDRKFCEQPDYNEGNGYKWQVILCNYKTGGVGLNFTAATEMIILDEEWNPGKADQAFGRIDRMGQTEETNVHILRIANSIDSWMVKLNEQKKEIIDGFESSASNVASDLLTAMKNGDII
jgi:SNF2 family DNA or RNA helicase